MSSGGTPNPNPSELQLQIMQERQHRMMQLLQLKTQNFLASEECQPGHEGFPHVCRAAKQCEEYLDKQQKKAGLAKEGEPFTEILPAGPKTGLAGLRAIRLLPAPDSRSA